VSTPLDYAKPSLPTRDAGSAAAGTCAVLCLMAAVFMMTGNLHNTLEPIVFIPWLAFGGFALLFSVLDARRHASSRIAVTAWASRGTNILLLVALILGGAIASGRIFGEDPHNIGRGQVKCASNLHQIGLTMMLYANEHGGTYPQTMDKLVHLDGYDISTEIFCCPASYDTPAAGPTTRAVAANLMAGGHLSYVYLGNGFRDGTSVDAVLARETLGHHQGGGINVLFGDLHVEFISEPQAKALIAELQAGHNPPRPPILRMLAGGPIPGKN
jgi:prepilin-type processing-associated H-X9-DG protein